MLVAVGLAVGLAGCGSPPHSHPAPTASSGQNAGQSPAPPAVTAGPPPGAPQPTADTAPTVPAGWKTYASGRVPAYSTVDWASFRTAEATEVSFSLRHPPDWHVDASVFLDARGRKVAEFLPGPVALQPGQACFDRPFTDPSHSSSLISQSSFTLGRFAAVRRVVEAPFEGAAGSGGTWRPVVDCAAEGHFAFVMAFYPTGAGDDPTAVAGQVLGSLQFTPAQ